MGLEGTIDEKANFANLVGPPPNPPKQMHVDCKNVVRINSMGVKGWIDYFRRVQAKRVQIHLWNVSQAVIQQINQVSNFSCGGVIHSMEASFECESCGHSWTQIVKTATVIENNLDLPEQKCPSCGEVEGLLDELPQIYFKFLHRDREKKDN